MPKLTKRFVDQLPETDRDQFFWDSELKGFGVVVRPASKRHPTGSKTFVVRFLTATGRDRRMVLGRYGVLTPARARDLAIEALAEARSGADPMEQRKGLKTSPTVADLAERYKLEHLPTKKPNSQDHDLIALKVHILPRLGSVKLCGVEGGDIARLHREIGAKTPTMANRVLALLRNMFGLAQRWGMLEGPNPCEHVKRYREVPRNRFLSDEELGQLGKALAEIDSERGTNRAAIAAIRLLALTGARRNEVLDLRWEDIDTQRRIAWLRDSKTGARALRLEEPALDLLGSLPRKGEWVFPSKRKPGTPARDVRKTWLRVLERAGIEKLRLHDLRHTKASVGAEMGLSLQVIGAMLGHARASTTERYAHLTADPVRSAEEQVQGHIAGALNGLRQ